MDKHEIYKDFLTITRDKYDACKAEAASVGKEHPTERGALQLKAGMYRVAMAAGLISGTDQAIELMHKRFGDVMQHFPAIANEYQVLSAEQKECMEIALYPEAFMRVNFYNTYQAELEAAKKEGEAQKVFQARIKKEVLEDILHMWRAYRVQNELFVFAFAERE